MCFFSSSFNSAISYNSSPKKKDEGEEKETVTATGHMYTIQLLCYFDAILSILDFATFMHLIVAE